MPRSAVRIAASTASAFLLLVAVMAIVCRLTGCVDQLFYYPDRVVYGSPADVKLSFREVDFASRDGTRLTGWFIPAVGAATGTVLHFHGNAQNMTAHFGYVDWLPRRGFNVIVFDYRGYGRSDGRPERRGVMDDSLAALALARTLPGVDPGRIVVLGQSLGAVQALVALGHDSPGGVRAVAADSAFFSYRSIVRDKIAAMPVLSWFKGPLSRIVVGDAWSAGDAVARIAPVPIVFLHGSADEVIPVDHARRLHAAAGEPKELWIVDGAGHTEALASPGPWRDRLVGFFLRALDGPPPDRR